MTNSVDTPAAIPLPASSSSQDPLYYEDCHPGRRIAHVRGRTVTEMDNVLLTHLTMNTAQAHFNEVEMRGTNFGQRLVFGGITASLVLGLASEDTAAHAVAELSLDRLRLKAPVFHGDTIMAFTEVIAAELDPDRPDAGRVRFRHWGLNQRDEIVCEAERTALLRRRPKSGTQASSESAR